MTSVRYDAVSTATFPYISDERRKEMLAPQPGWVRVVIDTDAANEVDDQFAITWGLLSPDRLDIEAIIAAPFSRAYFREPLLAAARAKVDESTAASVDSIAAWVHRLKAAGIDPGDLPFETTAEGMEMSYAEIDTIMSKLGMSSEGVAYRGADRFMESPDDIVDSEGARRIIEAAMADDNRLLHVVAIGALTNIAAALLMEPEIITRMVVSWTSGFPTFVRFSNSPSMNLVQDQHASRLLFDSGVPLLYLPVPAGLLHRRAALDVAAGVGAVGQWPRRDRQLPPLPVHAQPPEGSAPRRTLPGPVLGVLGLHQLRVADRPDLGTDHALTDTDPRQ